LQQWHSARETFSEKFGPKKLWTAQGVGHRRNKDDPLYKSGMAEKENLQKNCGPRKKFIAARMRKGPEYKNGIRDKA
jgi:hypothetical protein